jgi:FAD/FMN-containing dehydrogenase
MGALARAEPSYLRLLRTLKEAIDPRGVLAPGRYDAVCGD